MLDTKIKLDDDGYFYSPFFTAKCMTVFSNIKYNHHAIDPSKFDYKWFSEKATLKAKQKSNYLINFHEYCWGYDSFDRKQPSVVDTISDTTSSLEGALKNALGGSVHGLDSTLAQTNMMLIQYHLSRFMLYNQITYKIRPRMIDFFDSCKLDFKAELFLPPFKEFMISLPMGAIELPNLGSMFNIYVAEESFEPEAYSNKGDFQVQDNIFKLVSNNPGKIKRIIRCYGICYDKNLDTVSGKTVYYQLPVIEDEKIYDQFMALMSTCEFQHKDACIRMFDIVLKFCAYLCGSKIPDMQKVQGTIRKPKSNDEKKARAAARHNETNGYDYFDVGRICQSKPSEVTYVKDAMGRLMKRFTVHRHFRNQWYGPKTEESPNGTHQRVIIIEDFKKGPDDKELKPKMITV